MTHRSRKISRSTEPRRRSIGGKLGLALTLGAGALSVGCAASVQNECERQVCDSVCRNAGYAQGYCGIDQDCHCSYDVGGNNHWNPWEVPDAGDACGGTCPTRQLCCEGSCKDVESDPQNCGLCGRVCGEGEQCVNGWCVCGDAGTCIEGSEKCCEGQCVNILYDPTNCGDCGVECQAETGPECLEGTCVCPNLTESPRACDGTYEDMCCERTFLAAGGCFNLGDDREHCGSCDNTCPVFEGSICLAGQCTESPNP
jgi:hypothetical protein